MHFTLEVHAWVCVCDLAEQCWAKDEINFLVAFLAFLAFRDKVQSWAVTAELL